MSSNRKSKYSGKSYATFRRLLGYAAPYKFKLAVGIVAGMVTGGSMFSSFFWIGDLVKPFEAPTERESAMEFDAPPADDGAAADFAGNVTTADHAEDSPTPRQGAASETKPPESREILQMRRLADYLGVDVEDAEGRMTWQFFTLIGLGFIIVFFLRNLGIYINHMYMRWVGTKVVADLRDQMVGKLMNQSLKFYGKSDVGGLISRCTNDTGSVEAAVSHVIADATRCPWEILGCVGFIVYTSYRSGNLVLPLILFLGVPLTILPIIIIGRRIRRIYRSALHNISLVIGKMHEIFTGITVVKAYNMEEREASQFRKLNHDYFLTVVKAIKAELLMQPLMESVAVAASGVFLIYCYSQEVRLSAIVVLIVPAFLAYRPMKMLAKVNTYVQRSAAAADRFFEIIDMENEVRESDNPKVLADFKKEICLRDAVFSYDGHSRVLDGVNLTIPKGHVVAVVGETGSGKTTIANLIARFYDVDDGSVSIDGVDVRDLKTSSLRNLIGIVTQDTILFNDTIANNIAYGLDNAPMERIVEAAKQANAHQFIVGGHHQDGYESNVGEKGFKLSGGEKQRVAIARAILKNPPILILDEATSALDTVTERLVQDALDHVMANRTVFAIAHRLSTIKHANTIIVLDKGKIVEMGSHDELMERDGAYRKLHNVQFSVN